MRIAGKAMIGIAGVVLLIMLGVLCSFYISRLRPSRGRINAEAGEQADPLTALDARISKDFEAQWRNLERNAGTTSSLRVYSGLKVPARADGVMLRDALDWLEHHDWNIHATTATLIKKTIEQNPRFLEIFARGVALDAPLWPQGFDFNTPVPDYATSQCVSRLMLAHARFAAESDKNHAIAGALMVMTFGRHLQNENAGLISVMAGDDAQREALRFLEWLVTHEQTPLADCGNWARRLEQEHAQSSPPLAHLLTELRYWRELTMAEYSAIRREASGNPRLMTRVRQGLARYGASHPIGHLTDAQLLDLLSSTTLNRRYDEMTSLTLAYGRLAPAEQIKREDLVARFKNWDTFGVMPLSAMCDPTFFIMEQIPDYLINAVKTEGGVRRLITVLTLQQASLHGDLPAPQEALRRLGISPTVALDPFTGKPFACRVSGAGRATLQFDALEELKVLGLDPQPLTFACGVVKPSGN